MNPILDPILPARCRHRARPALWSILVLATLLAPSLAGQRPSPPGLPKATPKKVAKPRPAPLRSALVVSPRAATGGGLWVRQLLAPHGVTAEVVEWKKATVAHARRFDLVIVTGPDRRIRGRVETRFENPVLAIGSYGYTYFGKLDLKNGYPYS